MAPHIVALTLRSCARQMVEDMSRVPWPASGSERWR